MSAIHGYSVDLSAIRRWPSSQAEEWVKRFLAWVAREGRIRVVVAIGSAVRDVAKSVDLDLLIAYRGPALEVTTPPIDVDVRYFPADNLHQLALSGHDLIGWAIKYGIPIIDKDGYWQELTRVLYDRVPLPSKVGSVERAKRAESLLKQLLDVGDEDAASEQLLSYLTHLARAVLVAHGIYPASRPELVRQLRSIGEPRLAQVLDEAIEGCLPVRDVLKRLDPSYSRLTTAS